MDFCSLWSVSSFGYSKLMSFFSSPEIGDTFTPFLDFMNLLIEKIVSLDRKAISPITTDENKVIGAQDIAILLFSSI